MTLGLAGASPSSYPRSLNISIISNKAESTPASRPFPNHLHLRDLLDGHHLGVCGGVPRLDPHVVTPGNDVTSFVNQQSALEQGK